MTKTQRGGESLCIDAGNFGNLAFEWAEDRYLHRWRFAEAGNELTITSHESNSSTLWPASPPLQQIHLQNFGDGRQVIFGVGMAGRGHWSASFTLVPALASWIVELACRSPLAPGPLLSTYCLDGDWQWEAEQPSTLRCVQLNSPLHLEPVQPGAEAQVTDDRLLIRPTHVNHGSSTTQWAFRIRMG